MTKTRLFLLVIGLLGVVLGGFVIEARDNTADQPLVLSKMGVMYVGGRQIPLVSGGGRFSLDNQTQMVEQAPVHYLIPPADKQKGKLPVIMVPGMGLTSYIYLGTPDGRDGWAQLFAKAGHPVYVFDEPNNAISGFDVGKFNAVKQGDAELSELPRFMLWANEMAWQRWGIGSDVGKPFDDTRYPVKQIEQLYASLTPVYQGGSAGRGGDQVAGDSNATGGRQARRGGGAGRFGATMKAAALVKLLEKTGPAIIVVHSASGGTGFEAIRKRPDLVKAVVAVEVVGSPTDPEDIKKNLLKTQYIGLYGDHFDSRRMAGRYEAAEKTAELINKAGGKAEVILLPKLGIKGNCHLMMQDNNNDELAEMILKRLPVK